MMERIVEIPDSIETIKVTFDDPLSTKMLTGMPVREEIIRCRDCKFATAVTFSALLWCSQFRDNDGEMNAVEPNDFCAWAERDE